MNLSNFEPPWLIVTDNWGISVKRVEIKNIEPSADVQQAMEKQSAAERNRRAMVTEAKGEKKSKILRAEGERESRIIKAEGEKEERIRTAQGEAESIYLRAMASATMGEQATVVRSLEAFETAAKEDSNTFVIPYELSGTIGRLGRNLDPSNQLEDGNIFDALDLEDLPDGIQSMLDPEQIDLKDLEELDTEDLDMGDEGVDTPEEVSAEEAAPGEGSAASSPDSDSNLTQ